MDSLLSELAMKTASMVGRAAFGAASSLIVKQITEYIKKGASLDNNLNSKKRYNELVTMKHELQLKLNVLLPIVQYIEIMATNRTDSIIEYALPIVDEIKMMIEEFSLEGPYLKIEESKTTKAVEPLRKDTNSQIPLPTEINEKIRALLSNINGYLPILNLILSTIQNCSSSFQIHSTLPISKTIEASKLISSGLKITFPVTLFYLFKCSERPQNKSDFTWMEKVYKADLKIMTNQKYNRTINILRDFNDGRFHNEDEKEFEMQFDVSSIHKMFYSTSGLLLNIEDSNSAVLVLKITYKNEIEYYAVKMFEDSETVPESCSDSDSELELESDSAKSLVRRASDCETQLSTCKDIQQNNSENKKDDGSGIYLCSDIRLLEIILKLAGLESSMQKSHLLIPDEILLSYLAEHNSRSVSTSSAKFNSSSTLNS
ncbi:RanBD1 domain-containing protein [Zancudomyces culisetae]|uniref:RanBD1 domain-containing protein n=1 Tax=Zancudomyces culisetae TaxID=1213189 RepID=A0A1R1PDR4_ZANCU|nr:RanBD1 domain-containing protein [Zancudomyces culisetae]|eukprot:OMH79091.1 RanBD1 domain-containing protein [Zancudomyces culisetae]